MSQTLPAAITSVDLTRPPSTHDLISRSVFARADNWLDTALPFWAEVGLDRRFGGYVEQVGFDGSARDVGFKRTRVTARQIYVFSHAALLGRANTAAAAEHGYRFLVTNAWLGENGGWARQLFTDGRVKDSTPDLYDLAFVLFALGWFHRLTGDRSVEDCALRTLDFITAHMRPAHGKGFLSERPPTNLRLQNPHMHLLEATLVHLETTGDERFKQLADEIVDLFEDCFFDESTSTLAEFFDEDWHRVHGPQGNVVEPGHLFEWAWILANHQRITGRDLRRQVERLTAFAEAYGVDEKSTLTVNTVLRDGSVLDAGSRVWPNTERLQAAVAMFELFGRDPIAVFEESTNVLFQRFLDQPLRGGWIDRVDTSGRNCCDHMPASTLYHVMIAFTEMLRLKTAVGKQHPPTPL